MATRALFAEHPTRGSLLALRASWPLERLRVRVHRNVACELITSVAAPYLAFAGLEAAWSFGDYDDSLGFPADGDSDLQLISIDFSRFQTGDPAGVSAWLIERIRHLRQSVPSPLLITTDPRALPWSTSVNAALTEASAALPGVYLCDLSEIARPLGGAFFDARNAQLIGLPYSNVASVLLARALGSRWLPAVRRRIKAIVVDLDQTMYAGVLGEDGIGGVALEEGHATLQKQLLAYRDRGIFLGVCSKNEPEDVEALLRARTDFPLKAEHFSASAIGWTDKRTGLRQIAQQLRIGLDATLYIDDNPGELAAIAAELPDLRLLHAGPQPAITQRALAEYPGLHQWRWDETDKLRIADLAAAAERERDADRAGDKRAYLESLGMRVRFRVDFPGDIDRLHALSGKTNQFNLNIKRLQASEVAQYVRGADRHAVAVELADRLSDSGIIAAVFFRVVDDICYVDEVCVSCRALGRGLEDLLVLGAVRVSLGLQGVPTVVLSYTRGPRNTPARQWLEQLHGQALAGDSGTAAVPWQRCAEQLARIDDLVRAETVQSAG